VNSSTTLKSRKRRVNQRMEKKENNEVQSRNTKIENKAIEKN
jgi:hypothetical protein